MGKPPFPRSIERFVMNSILEHLQTIKVSKNCNNKDTVTDLLKFRIPTNEVFSEQAVQSSQLKFLRKKVSRAEQGRKLFDQILEEDSDILRKDIKKINFTINCVH